MQAGPDYTKLNDFDLVDLFERLDPRWSEAQCAQIKDILISRGFLVKDGDLGPGWTTPSPERLEKQLGSRTAIAYPVRFDQNQGPYRLLAPAQNDLGLVGGGMLVFDGVFLRLSSSRFADSWRFLKPLFRGSVDLRVDRIWNVETDDNALHLESRSAKSLTEAITIWFADSASAEHVAALLPNEKAPDFRPQLQRRLEFAQALIARSPASVITSTLILLNILAFIVTFAAGAEFLIPTGTVQIAWGSNFGPYTTDGEWWRLLTSLFLNFGLVQLLVNLWGLASFGPLAERLFGKWTYLLIFLSAGLVGGEASLLALPAANMAGPSAATFGLIGALLAVALRGRSSYPMTILRSIRKPALIFAVLVLLLGFAHKGIVNAANLGGSIAGFTAGLLLFRPADEHGQSSLRRAILYTSAGVILVSLVLGGVWGAQRAAKKLTGDGLYWQTTHALQKQKLAVDATIKADLASATADRRNTPKLLSDLESVALPFWNDAVARMEDIQLPLDSPNKSNLEDVLRFAHGRKETIARVIAGLRSGDPGQVATAELQLQQTT